VLAPGGRLDLGLHLRRDMEGRVRPLGGRHGPPRRSAGHGAPCPCTSRGGFTFAGGDVALEDLTIDGRGIESACHGRFGPNGPRGRLSARLDLLLERELLDLLPASVRATFAEMTKDRLLVAEALDVDVVPNGLPHGAGRPRAEGLPKAPPGGAPRGLVELDPVVVSAPTRGASASCAGSSGCAGVTMDGWARARGGDGRLEIARLRTGDDPEGEAVLRIESARIAGLTVEALEVPIALGDGILRPVRSRVPPMAVG
jgi:hypothetical protein